MWGYEKVNDTWKECVKCGAVVRNTDKHTDWHRFHGDETPLYELALPVRVDNVLRRYGLFSVEALIADIGNDDALLWLYDLRGVGHHGAHQALGVLQQHGIVDTSGKIIKD
jgi:hypothetical protein